MSRGRHHHLDRLGGRRLRQRRRQAFIASLKTELIYRRSWPTRDEAELAIFDYIEAVPNPRRRHTTIGAVSPVAFEDAYAKEAALG